MYISSLNIAFCLLQITNSSYSCRTSYMYLNKSRYPDALQNISVRNAQKSIWQGKLVAIVLNSICFFYEGRCPIQSFWMNSNLSVLCLNIQTGLRFFRFENWQFSNKHIKNDIVWGHNTYKAVRKKKTNENGLLIQFHWEKFLPTYFLMATIFTTTTLTIHRI